MANPAIAATAGTAAMDAAKKYGPDVIKKAQQYLNKSGAGKSIATLAKGSISEQAAVITALSRGGLGPDVIKRAIRELTPAESAKWDGLVNQIIIDDANASDRAAVPHASVDSELESIVRSKMIHEACGYLGITSDQLGLLVTLLRTVTHAEIERYQRDFKILGIRAR